MYTARMNAFHAGTLWAQFAKGRWFSLERSCPRKFDSCPSANTVVVSGSDAVQVFQSLFFWVPNSDSAACLCSWIPIDFGGWYAITSLSILKVHICILQRVWTCICIPCMYIMCICTWCTGTWPLLGSFVNWIYKCERFPSRSKYQVQTHGAWSGENVSCHPRQDSLLICVGPYETSILDVSCAASCRPVYE